MTGSCMLEDVVSELCHEFFGKVSEGIHADLKMLSELEAVCELQTTTSFHPGASDEKGGKICHQKILTRMTH